MGDGRVDAVLRPKCEGSVKYRGGKQQGVSAETILIRKDHETKMLARFANLENLVWTRCTG